MDGKLVVQFTGRAKARFYLGEFMPSKAMITKSATDEQVAALEKAAENAGMTKAQAIDAALQAFCEAHGVQWPTTGKHGGLRPGAFGNKPDESIKD